jgi:hypothetical protein
LEEPKNAENQVEAAAGLKEEIVSKAERRRPVGSLDSWIPTLPPKNFRGGLKKPADLCKPEGSKK